jgi:hypothetical protein
MAVLLRSIPMMVTASPDVMDTDALFQRVMAGVERLMRGDGERTLEGLSDDEQNLALIISGRSRLHFCDD